MKFNSTLDKIKIYDSRFELSLLLDRNAFDQFISNVLGYVLRGIRFTGKNVT